MSANVVGAHVFFAFITFYMLMNCPVLTLSCSTRVVFTSVWACVCVFQRELTGSSISADLCVKTII